MTRTRLPPRAAPEDRRQHIPASFGAGSSPQLKLSVGVRICEVSMGTVCEPRRRLRAPRGHTGMVSSAYSASSQVKSGAASYLGAGSGLDLVDKRQGRVRQLEDSGQGWDWAMRDGLCGLELRDWPSSWNTPTSTTDTHWSSRTSATGTAPTVCGESPERGADEKHHGGCTSAD